MGTPDSGLGRAYAPLSSHTTVEVRQVDTSLESHSTKIEGRRIESKTRQGLDATNKPQRLAYGQSGASRAPLGPEVEL